MKAADVWLRLLMSYDCFKIVLFSGFMDLLF